MAPQKIKSPILRELHSILKDCIRRIENDECSEAEVYGMLGRFNAESKGFFDNHSTLNYDEAAEELGIRNRTKMNEVCKLNGVFQKQIKNNKIGFLRSEIDDLAQKIRTGKAKGIKP